MNNQKSAFIAIVGRPNVGKSSLMNKMLGHKIAIVSDKPQTTRTRITGILTKEELQLVFIDTPGMHRPHDKLGENMVRAAGSSIGDVDVCVLVADASEFKKSRGIAASELKIMDKFKAGKIPCILAINKIDLVPEREKLLDIITTYNDYCSFNAVVPLSAKSGDGVDRLIDELSAFAGESPHFFDENALTDQSERTIAAETVREKLLRMLDREVPHGIAVSVEKFADRTTKSGDDIIDIDCIIYCESDSHKGIIIGKGGEMLKKVSSSARKDLERFFECKINLSCWVKVKEDWRNRDGIIHNFGLDFKL